MDEFSAAFGRHSAPVMAGQSDANLPAEGRRRRGGAAGNCAAATVYRGAEATKIHGMRYVGLARAGQDDF